MAPTRPRSRRSAPPDPSAQGDGPFAAASPKEARILSAALDLFVEDGFHGTSIPAIARRAGVAAGTIYTYFAGKQELVNALVTRVKGRLAAQLGEALAPLEEGATATEVRAGFDALWGVFAGFGLRHPRAMTFCDLHHHASYLAQATREVWEPSERLLDAHFEAGRRAGVYRDLPPAVLRSQVAGALIGAHKFARAGAFEITPQLLEDLREASWSALTRSA